MTNDWYNCQGVLCGFTDAVFKENYEFKDTLKAFDDFKNKQQKLWSNVFRYAKVYIFWKLIQSLYIEIKHRY